MFDPPTPSGPQSSPDPTWPTPSAGWHPPRPARIAAPEAARSTSAHPTRAHSRRRWTAAVLAVAAVLGALAAVAPHSLTLADFPTSDSANWKSGVVVTPSITQRRGVVKMTIDVTSSAKRNVLVDVEIHSSNGKVFQQFWGNQQFSRGQTRRFTATWTVAANEPLGRHDVKVGVFGNGWTSLKHWNDRAAIINVGTSAPTTTVPGTTMPATTMPATTMPATTSPVSTAPPTTVPPTNVPPTVAPTTVAPTTVAPTTVPPSTSPPTTTAPTTAPPTTASPTTAPPPLGNVQFFEDFSTADAFARRFQTQVFHGTGQTPTDITMWHGDHDMSCGGPTTQRDVHVNNPAEMFWHCAPKGPDSGHIMTSMYTTGYGQVNFAPNQTFTNINRVCWDQSLTEMGGRKWTQMVVVPEATYVANGYRLNYVRPPLQNDVAVNGLRVDGDTFMFELLRGSTTTYVGQTSEDNDFTGYVSGVDKATRFKHCVTDLGNGTVRVEMFGRPGGTDTRVMRGSLPNGRVRVIFQDDNYDPPKDDMSNDTLTTWHWDNIEIS